MDGPGRRSSTSGTSTGRNLKLTLPQVALETYDAHRNGAPNLMELLATLAKIIVSHDPLPATDDAIFFLISLLAELLGHAEPQVVGYAMVIMNRLLRLDSVISRLRAVWLENKAGTKTEITLQHPEDTQICFTIAMVSQASLLKVFAGFLNGKRAEAQLGSLACMSAMLLTPPEDPRAAKLFCSGTLAKTFQLCMDVLHKTCDAPPGEVDPAQELCVDLLTDLLVHNQKIAASLLMHPPFGEAITRVAQASCRRTLLLQLLRITLLAAGGCEEAVAVREAFSNPEVAQALLRQLLQGSGDGAETGPGPWQEQLRLLISIQQSPLKVSPLDDFIGCTVEAFQPHDGNSTETLSPYAVILFTELLKQDATLCQTVRSLLLPDHLSAFHGRLSSQPEEGRRPEMAVFFTSLAQCLEYEGPWETDQWLQDMAISCLRVLQSSRCPVLRHHCAASFLSFISKTMPRLQDSELQRSFIQRMCSTLRCLPPHIDMPRHRGIKRSSQMISRRVSMDTDDELTQSPSAHYNEQLQRRIRQLEEENGQRQQRLNQMTAEYKSLEATLVEIREWSQRSIMFDRDKMEELSSLRDFQAKHLSCEAINDMRIKDLTDGLDHKTKKLEDTYMKLILLTKAHQKVLTALEQQQRRNDDLQGELKRLSQAWKAKEEQQEQVLKDLRLTFANATQEHINHSATASEALKSLETQVSNTAAENSNLKEKLQTFKSQLQAMRAQAKQQDAQVKQQEQRMSQMGADNGHLQDNVRRLEQELAKQNELHTRLQEQHQQLGAKAQEVEGRCKEQTAEIDTLKAELNRVRAQLRDMDARLQRYSSVTSLIHSLAKDPENATQGSCPT